MSALDKYLDQGEGFSIVEEARAELTQLRADAEALRRVTKERDEARKSLDAIKVGPLDAFNAPASRIHRALSFARQHGYHETDEAFGELHGLRAAISSQSATLAKVREILSPLAELHEKAERADGHPSASWIAAFRVVLAVADALPKLIACVSETQGALTAIAEPKEDGK